MKKKEKKTRIKYQIMKNTEDRKKEFNPSQERVLYSNKAFMTKKSDVFSLSLCFKEEE